MPLQFRGVGARTLHRPDQEIARRLKDLEAENARLKKPPAEAELDKAMLKELAEGKW